jgi:hypothetical protein
MDAIAEKLDERLREWELATAQEVRQRVIEIIESADLNLLDIMRSRAAEQDVLDLLDDSTTR